jgi:hypothetical protein
MGKIRSLWGNLSKIWLTNENFYQFFQKSQQKYGFEPASNQEAALKQSSSLAVE